MESIEARKIQLEQWLMQTGMFASLQLLPLAGDASFRRYYRLIHADHSWIVMDAPPPQENVIPFVAVATALRAWGVQTPEIVAAEPTKGFLLLTDFGDATYLKTLTPDNATDLYQTALIALARLQSCRQVPGHIIPPFTTDFMWQEWAWHKEWFLDKLLGLNIQQQEKILDDCYASIVSAAASQPQVFMHRDFHSANLMVLPDQTVGVLDFQDAFIGPLTYDLASLLRDCYISWPEQRVQQWVAYYLNQLQAQGEFHDVTLKQLLYWFDMVSMQRHLKALLTFARKYVRDDQPQYLQHIPRTLNYLCEVSSRYPAFLALHEFLRDSVQPTFERKVMPLCAQ